MARVYLSSTYEDLKAHRTAVWSVLRKMHHDVVGMEEYAAADNRPFTRCVADVQAADVYVGLFAWRYGHEPAEAPGRSITELEYRAATAAQKRRLIFMARDDAPWPMTFVDATSDATKGRKVQNLRAELRATHMVGEFTSPDDLAAAVAAAVSLELSIAASPPRRDLALQLSQDPSGYELADSAVVSIADALRGAANATVLELDFGATEWWSTRLHLVALVASDYTGIEALVLLDSERIVGVATVRALRQALQRVHPAVEATYCLERAEAATRPALDPYERIESFLVSLGGRLAALSGGEESVRVVVKEPWLRTLLSDKLATEAVEVPHGPARAVDLYEIISKPSRFVPLVRAGTFDRVIDRLSLAAQVAAALLRERLS